MFKRRSILSGENGNLCHTTVDRALNRPHNDCSVPEISDPSNPDSGNLDRDQSQFRDLKV